MCGVVGIFISSKRECCRKWTDFDKCSLWLMVDLRGETRSALVEVVVLRRLRRGCVVTSWRTYGGLADLACEWTAVIFAFCMVG